MFHLTWKGMIGRRKESSLLLIVLVLSFLLSSALAIILPSTQAEAQLQRESSYGSWKLMLLERSSEECEALAQALSEQGAQCAVLPSVSLSSEGELTSVMTPEAMTLGNFRLLEGRLPEAENEILLVENQFAIGALPEVGENITVRFVWSAEAADAEAFEQQQRRRIDEAFDRGLTQLIPSRMDEYLAFIAEAKENWQRDRTSVTYPYLTRDCLGRDEPVDPKNMTPEELEVSIKAYCHGKTYFQFYSPDAEDHTATCWNLAEAEGLEMKNNFREKEERLAACQSQRVMTVLLGAAAVLLVMIILLFILSDMAEQERRRIGILRALGASRGAIRRTHWLLAMQESLRAVLLANAAYALILLGCAFFETNLHTLSSAALVTTLTQGLLWQYPWSLHLCLCLAALVLITLLRVLPYHRLCQSSVIGTIKGLERGE